MKEEILKLLDDKYEALDLIEINDLLNLTTPEDLKLLEKTLNALVDECILYKIFRTLPSLFPLYVITSTSTSSPSIAPFKLT